MVNESYEDAYDMIMESMVIVKNGVDVAFEKKTKLWFFQAIQHNFLNAELNFLYGKHRALCEIAEKILKKREALLNTKEKSHGKCTCTKTE